MVCILRESPASHVFVSHIRGAHEAFGNSTQEKHRDDSGFLAVVSFCLRGKNMGN